MTECNSDSGSFIWDTRMSLGFKKSNKKNHLLELEMLQALL